MGDRVALVTGGSRGIGRAITIALARSGHPVAVSYLSRDDEAKETLALVEEIGGEGVAVKADIGDPEDVTRAFAETEEALGPVHVLVNNAGVRGDGLALSMSDGMWENVLRINLSGTFFCCRRALRSMLRARWGRIVNVSSVAGLRASPGQTNYSAAKAGMQGMARTIAIELGPFGINVNAVAPGHIDTAMTRTVAERAGIAYEDLVENTLKMNAIKRVGTPEDVANAIAFLASDEAEYITGQILYITGRPTV